jgi:transposase
MLGRKVFTPKLLYQFSLEAQVPEGHLLRRVAAAVDFGFVRRLTARFYSHTGRPGIDPEVLFKMGLLGYLYGITSERRLAEEVRLHLAYRWFLGYDLDEATPDHSALSKARARFGLPVYTAFFTEVVRQCARAGLVRGDVLYVDSTLLEANASAESAGARALLAQLPGAAGFVEAVWRENAGPPAGAAAPPRAEAVAGGTPEDAGGPTGEPAVGEDAPGRAPLHVAGPADPPNGRQGTVNELVRSRTDPEAGLVKRDGVPFGFSYKAHLGVDGGRARLITAVDVTPGEVADEHLLDRLLKEHAGATGRTVTEVVADTKYGTHENYTALERQGIRASIPPHSTTSDRGAYSAGRFVYDAVADRFRCPTGQVLTRQGSSRTAGAAGGLIYRARPKVCGACPAKAQCCPSGAARTLLRPNDAGLRDRVLAYLRTPRARRSRRRRLAWAETANAELKERHGLRRARCRGRDKVLIQALGAATAYDVKKLAQLCGPGPATRSAALARCPRHRPQVAPHRPARPTAGRGRRCSAKRRPHPSVTAEALTDDFSNTPVGSI